MPSSSLTVQDHSASTSIPEATLNKLDPEYRKFVLSLPPSPPKPTRNPPWSSKFRQSEIDEPPELGEAPGIPVGSTRTIELGGFSANVLIPFGDRPKRGWPVLIWVHGGGWVFGHADSGLSTYSRACVGSHAAESAEARCVVMSVEYRRAPEHPFPAAVDDLWSTLTWIRNEGKNALGIDPNKIAVGGASAGGNLAAVLAQRAAAASPPIPIALQVLMVPITDCTFTEDDRSGWTPSMIEYADIYALRAVDMLWFRDLYIPNAAQRRLSDASPLYMENESVFKNLAPTWVGVAELDVLRSEGEAYAEKMKKHGVPVTLTMYRGATHLTPAADRVCALARRMRSDQVEAIKAAFSRR
ncbi:hypothetical protein FRC09_008809 [Ceratobasidium sp. 395]|nr:hypothetical protein FRC09_008809 [Ceratobasidium sp. 395]